MMTRRTGQAMAVSALTIAILCSSTGVASASEPSASEPESSNVVTEAEVDAARLPAEDGPIAAEVQNYLDVQVRLGNPVSIQTLDVAEVDLDGIEATIVIPDGLEVLGVGAEAVSTSANADVAGMGFAVMPDAEADSQTSPAEVGFGFGGGLSPSGMVKVKPVSGQGACSTIYFSPQYASSSSHILTTCYEKWHRTNAREWIYNRWGWFTRAAPTARYAAILDFTFRSRPYQGYESRVTGFNDHTDAYPSTSCGTTATASLSAGPASLSIPISRCSNTTVLPDANKKSGGMDWNGKTTSQLKLDYGISIVASNSTIEPIYADYAWMEVCDSLVSATCAANPSQYLVHKDAGWYWP